MLEHRGTGNSKQLFKGSTGKKEEGKACIEDQGFSHRISLSKYMQLESLGVRSQKKKKKSIGRNNGWKIAKLMKIVNRKDNSHTPNKKKLGLSVLYSKC